MKLNQYLLLVIFVFIAAVSESTMGSTSGDEIQAATESELQSGNETDSVTNQKFIFQTIHYYAPRSRQVYLVWKIENYPLEKATIWNSPTRLNNGLLYTPMTADGDTFRIQLKVPDGIILQYYFWITKNKRGHYQDFWDLQSSGKTVVQNNVPIIKKANYSKKVTGKISLITDKSWIILVLLVVVYFSIQVMYRKRFLKKEKPNFSEKVIFTGLSLLVFHSLARSEIIGINLLNTIHDFGIPAKIVKAGLSDFSYVFCLLVPFLVIMWLVKNTNVKKWIYGIFVFLALFSTLAAYTNIKTVIYLGKPFNYQWLYYGDFLRSEESKTAMSANLSLKTIINMVSFCISMFLFSGVLLRINRLLALQKKLKYAVYSVLGLLIIVLGYKSLKTGTTWTKGQSENAISSMIYSVITINSSSSFFTAEVPDDMVPFNPAQAEKMETPILIPENHKVKNIVFIILESAGAVYFDEYGGKYNLSPNLNRYSKHALMFEKAYAHAPATNRSLISILGSIYPYISYKSLTQEAPQMEHPTISSVLKNKGYRTSFFSSANLNFQNCRNFLAYRDFDVVEDFSMIDCVEEFQLDDSDYKEGNGIDDMCLVDCLTTWLDEDTTKNFFSLIWTVQGHYPYFFAGEEEEFGVSDYNFNRYLNCLKHNDELIGRVMQELEWRGLDKTRLVVVVGDHGEAFGQHKQYGHGTALYEENLRVPLYFINSGLFHGQRKSDIAGMKDLASTSLSIIGVDVPGNWQGRNLLATDSREIFFFAPWSDYLFGYRKNNMKFIFNESLNKVEVYDLSVDPDEKTNLIDTDVDSEVKYARNRITTWVQFQNKFIMSKLNQEN